MDDEKYGLLSSEKVAVTKNNDSTFLRRLYSKTKVNNTKKSQDISPHLAQPGRASGCSCRLRAEKQQSTRHTETGLSKAQILQWGPLS